MFDRTDKNPHSVLPLPTSLLYHTPPYPPPKPQPHKKGRENKVKKGKGNKANQAKNELP